MATKITKDNLNKLQFTLGDIVKEKERLKSALLEITLKTISPTPNNDYTESISSDAHLLLFFVNSILLETTNEVLEALIPNELYTNPNVNTNNEIDYKVKFEQTLEKVNTLQEELLSYRNGSNN
jgi:hypothetical protein